MLFRFFFSFFGKNHSVILVGINKNQNRFLWVLIRLCIWKQFLFINYLYFFLSLYFRETADGVKQCASLCLVKLFRINTEVLPRTAEMASRICQMINDSNLVIAIVLFFNRYRSTHPEVFCRNGVLRNFLKVTGKYLCQSLFFSKVADWGLQPY